ncbi:biotin carboxylase N-terminal domain-containing protein [Nocardioides sp. MH1]|uniref:ATP-binding protein n=1 Tax=Nocardioides sp. MH1 TaxID=3242490 RepID=UPI003522B3D7
MKPLFSTVYIANRGEIAARVARTCSGLGIRAVAGTDAFLDADAQVAAALAAGAEAVHPGYGFLSENAGFARAVADAGLTWIGPTPEVIERMGRKDAAREIAVAAGVPVVPQGTDAAFPVLVKAAAGGGGKGMRIVRSAAELDEAIAAAKRESLAAFGDDTMLIEKYVERGRHIEVQVMGDSHGNVVHLLTRECSAQRRHQKVIEEAPAPYLADDVRERIHGAAVTLAESVGYTNAGTVEFLLDAATGDFYFLEMNTRLQVEHPVTEEATGLDLVQLQLLVAAGHPLPFEQHEVVAATHAIEARVYAEDAYNGFLPQAGRATLVRWPHGRPGVRIDHALESGQVVSTAFDPMLGKVIGYGSDREDARRELVAALDETVILGLTTNTGFLRELAASEPFATGEIDTAWLDRNPPVAPDPAPARELAAHLWQQQRATTSGPFASDGFRLGGPAAPTLVEIGGVVVRVTPGSPSQRRDAAIVTEHGVELAHRGQRYVFERPDAAADHAAEASDGTVVAPMPGTVLDVRVAEGATVAAGDVLGVVEAMKMELALKAPYDGVVTSVSATAGAQVALGAPLFTVEES